MTILLVLLVPLVVRELKLRGDAANDLAANPPATLEPRGRVAAPLSPTQGLQPVSALVEDDGVEIYLSPGRTAQHEPRR